MSVGLILTCVIAVALLILICSSKIFNIIIGFLTTIAGVAVYFWFYSGAWLSNLQMIYEYKITPDQLRIYSLIAIGVGVVLLIIGVARGKKTEKIVIVKDNKKTESKAQEAEKVEDKKQEENKVVDDKQVIKNKPKEEKKVEENKEQVKEEETKTEAAEKNETEKVENSEN